MGRLTWLVALLGVLALHAAASQALAQGESELPPDIEVITEPPPQLERRLELGALGRADTVDAAELGD